MFRGATSPGREDNLDDLSPMCPVRPFCRDFAQAERCKRWLRVHSSVELPRVRQPFWTSFGGRYGCPLGPAREQLSRVRMSTCRPCDVQRTAIRI
jgi:hypothetical protein